MGLIDKLRSVSGIIKNRLASATGALRGLVSRLPAPIRRVARLGRLTSPLGIGITAATFAPTIARFVRRGLAPARQAVTRGVAFVGGQRVVTAAGAGGVVGILSGRKKGEVDRVIGQSRFDAPGTRARRKAAKRKPTKKRRKKRIPAHGHRVVSVRRSTTKKRRKKRTHSSPRHRGHTRVKFTTADGRKVSFLANPKARHR